MVIIMKDKRGKRARISLMGNRRGWIEIIEASVAILLVVGVILVLINKGSIQKDDISSNIYESEVSILREIQTNDTLRQDILDVSTLPAAWDSSLFPQDVKNRIVARTPNYLDCVGKICYMNETCSLGEVKEKDIYSHSVAIVSTLKGVAYRQLNLFCWTK